MKSQFALLADAIEEQIAEGTLRFYLSDVALLRSLDERLLTIDTLARNVAEYPDRIPLLIAAIERVADRAINDRECLT